MAERSAERHRRAAGDHRPRDGRPLRRVHRQCGDRRELADLPCRHCLHSVALHGDGRARLALRRGERSPQGQQDRLPGVCRRAGDGRRHHGAAWVGAVAASSGARERHAGGARGSAALPPDDVPVQHRDAAVLHDGRSTACRRRSQDPAPAWRGNDDAEYRIERAVDPGLGTHSGIRHTRRGARHRDRQYRPSRLSHCG